MGATIQKTRFSSKTKRILTDESPNLSAGSDIQVISGTDILTNNQVRLNIPTSASTSLTSMPAGQLILVNYYRSILRFPCVGLVPLLAISIWNSWTLDIYFGLSETLFNLAFVVVIDGNELAFLLLSEDRSVL